MITLINVFIVEPSNQQTLVDLLVRATDEFVSRAPGFVSSTLHRSLDGTKVTMYAQWNRAEDYEAMRRDPDPPPFLCLLISGSQVRALVRPPSSLRKPHVSDTTPNRAFLRGFPATHFLDFGLCRRSRILVAILALGLCIQKFRSRQPGLGARSWTALHP